MGRFFAILACFCSAAAVPFFFVLRLDVAEAAVPATTAYRESGKFAYRVCYRGGIAVRSEANVDATLTGSVIQWNQVFWGVERYAPVGSDVIFVRLEEPSHHLLCKKYV